MQLACSRVATRLDNIGVMLDILAAEVNVSAAIARQVYLPEFSLVAMLNLENPNCPAASIARTTA